MSKLLNQLHLSDDARDLLTSASSSAEQNFIISHIDNLATFYHEDDDYVLADALMYFSENRDNDVYYDFIKVTSHFASSTALENLNTCVRVMLYHRKYDVVKQLIDYLNEFGNHVNVPQFMISSFLTSYHTGSLMKEDNLYGFYNVTKFSTFDETTVNEMLKRYDEKSYQLLQQARADVRYSGADLVTVIPYVMLGYDVYAIVEAAIDRFLDEARREIYSADIRYYVECLNNDNDDEFGLYSRIGQSRYVAKNVFSAFEGLLAQIQDKKTS